MTKNRSDGLETRRRLLDAAAEVFAEKGFHSATTAEICRAAEANVAAINYHFGSKDNLYVEAWRHVFQLSIEMYPPDGGVSASASAEARLRGQLLALMHRIMDPASLDLDIVHKEMSGPTGLLQEVMHECLEPLRLAMDDVIRELLGRDATEQHVRLCGMSIHSQCFGPMIRERHHREEEHKGGPPGSPVRDIGVEAMAEHILQFSLAGIQRIRNSLRKSSSGKKSGRTR